MTFAGNEDLSSDRAALTSIAQQWLRFWQGRSSEHFYAIHDTTFVDHSPDGRSTDREAFRRGIEDLYDAFPNFKAEIDLLAIDEIAGLVTIGWSASARMEGRFMGMEPTGGRIAFNGIEVIKIRDLQVVERWGEWNEGSIRRQVVGHSRSERHRR